MVGGWWEGGGKVVGRWLVTEMDDGKVMEGWEKVLGRWWEGGGKVVGDGDGW